MVINVSQFLYKFSSGLLTPLELRTVAQKKNWVTRLAGPLDVAVERDILTFDTFAVIAELGGGMLQFGGGTILNWVFARHSPRFSFDIDSQILKAGLSKESVLEGIVKQINSELKSSEKVISIRYAEKKLEIGTIELDHEKDKFHDVLSLKRRVFARKSGNEVHRYIRKELKITDKYSKEDIKLKDQFGGYYPRIEEVRIEIGIPRTHEELFPNKLESVLPLVFPDVDVQPVKTFITEREFIMASKLHKIVNYFKEDTKRYTADIVKAATDVWACAAHCDFAVLKSYFTSMCENKGIPKNEAIKQAEKVLEAIRNDRGAIDFFKRGGQTSLLAQTHSLGQLVRVVERLLVKLRR